LMSGQPESSQEHLPTSAGVPSATLEMTILFARS
jgi:hypothetical protein